MSKRQDFICFMYLNQSHLFSSNQFFRSTLPVRKLQGLGGKFGEKICEDLNIQFVGDLIRFSKEELQRRYDERNGQWLYNIARGIDLEAVTPRLVSKSIGCCKKFPGRNAISAITTLTHWLHELAKEISERLEQDEMENNRRPKQMVVSFVQSINNADISSSRTVNLTSLDEEKIVNDAIDILKRNTEKFFKSPDNCTVLNNPIKFLGLNVGKFESTDGKKGNTIQDMFQRTIENKKNEVKDESNDKPANGEDDNEPDERQSAETKTNDDATKESYFVKYFRLQKEKQAAAEEAARLAEEERLRNENQKDDNDASDEENTFNNEMLLEELEQNNQSMQEEEAEEIKEESSEPTTSSKVDYMQTYAEFHKPLDKIVLPKVECDQCGKKVNAHEIQVHKDEHFAFQLTQEQRTEFQNQLKRNISSTTPAAKKQKTTANNKSRTPIKSASIQKFLVKPNDEVIAATPSASKANDIETEKCSDCGKFVPITELFEHQDFHAAKKLHDELMRAEMANRANNNSSAGKTVSAGKSKKPKKKTAAAASTSSSAPNAMKNIASFFQNS